ncbi:MAG: hypothetical protein RL153_1026, partial [Verrucomicrobiota bacterium]
MSRAGRKTWALLLIAFVPVLAVPALLLGPVGFPVLLLVQVV